MENDIEFLIVGFIVALIVECAWVLIKRSKDNRSSKTNKIIVWVGYSLLVMSVFLIAVGVLQMIDMETHREGH